MPDPNRLVLKSVRLLKHFGMSDYRAFLIIEDIACVLDGYLTGTDDLCREWVNDIARLASAGAVRTRNADSDRTEKGNANRRGRKAGGTESGQH